MKILEDFDWSFKSIMKIVGLVLLATIVLSIIASLIAFSFKTIFNNDSYTTDNYYGGDTGMYDMSESSKEAVSSKLSMSNVVPPETPGYSSGNDAENFEIKSYNATIKTYYLANTCEKISSLKSRAEVIFESSNINDQSCSYSFKVEKDKTQEIMNIIEDLDPESLNENIQSIKDNIEGYTDELEIYKKKLESIEDTLSKAQDAYDEVTKLATEKEDVESLTNIIDKKLGLIEKLTTERLSVKEQIDRFTKDRSKELDKLQYTFFSVYIYEEKIFDWEGIKNSWEYQLKSLINNFNSVIQGLSVNLLSYILQFIQIAIYFFISLFLLKFVWYFTKKVWKGKES